VQLQETDKIIETPVSTGIQLFVLAALKQHSLSVSFVILLFVYSVSALEIVFANSWYESTAKWETRQIF
jgi:hypothetical protein